MAVKTKKTPNAKQQECIDNINGKYLVLAGPGTGKTFTIIERIKNMLNKGIEPEKILCLTFTDAAANEMKKRIETELHIVSCGVQIFTYHGFCCSVIDEYPDEFEVLPNYKVIPDAVSKAFIKECIDEIKPKYFRTDKNDPYFYINTIKNRISAIKQNRLTKEQYFKNIKENPDWAPGVDGLKLKIESKIKAGKTNYKTDAGNLESLEKKINQAYELWEFYEKYQDKMDRARYMDFNDMINLVLDKFENNKGFLNQVANKFEYIMVDEYQDTNRSQNEIVFVLSHAIETENVFVVGDDNQIIYRFQGAKLETIANFLTEFPDSKVICLVENMRSTQEILDAARAVILQDPLNIEKDGRFKEYGISKELIAKNEEVLAKSKPVRFYKYADIMQEYTEIVNEIEGLVNSDKCPSDKNGNKKYSEIAILTRSNIEAQSFADLFKQRNIPYELKDGKNIFTITAVNVLFFYIQFLINPALHSFRIFQILTAQPFGIDPKDYVELFKDVSKEKTFIDVLRKGEWDKYKEPEKLQNFLKTYDYLTEYKSKENIKNTILEIGSKTGIFDYYLNTDINRTESIAGLKCFIDEATGFSDVYKTSFLEEFHEYIKVILEDEETLNTEKAPVNMNAVQICTYHSSKGREFEYVYMPTLTADKWETNTKSLKSDIPLDISEYKTEEELRVEIKPSDLTKLMYVAMTRAKHTLRLSYPEQINGKVKKPTKFLANIQDMFQKNEEEPFEYDEITYWNQAANLLIKKDYDYKKDFDEFIIAKLSNRAFSPSSINNYLSCPRKYLYENILEFPSMNGNPNTSSYGRAIHKACEEAIRFLRDNKTVPEKEQIVKWFKDELSKQPMQSYQHREIFEGRGEQALRKYYPQIYNTAPTRLFDVEYKLEYELEDGTKFIGFIDRLDINDDGTYTIYDYKTGNNKNRDIEVGKDHEDYYNQMALYKYFFERKTGKKVSLTKFIYPEDFESKNDGIEFTENEINDVVEKFKQAIADIKSLKFEPSYKEKACKYCNHKAYCGMNKL